VVRIVGLQLILIPAAYVLPKRVAFVIADALSLALLILPKPGLVTYLEMRRAFEESHLRSLGLARRWLAQPFRDCVVLKRVLLGREATFDWKIREMNAEGVRRLREAGESYIVASGHYAREAVLGLYSPEVTPGSVIQVGFPVPTETTSLRDVRIRIQYGLLVKTLSVAWGRGLEFVSTGAKHVVSSLPLYRRLRQRGTVVCMHVDAPWDWQKSAYGTFSRAFAGDSSRRFATGAAQLAQLAGCPVVACSYGVDGDGTIVLEWGEPIKQVSDVIATANDLLDTLEIAVGERPTQYMFPIGEERRWNRCTRRWEARS
jgi:hypothetical protein